MTNHFHFLIEVTDKSLEPIKSGDITMPAITNAFRLLQSAYAKGINKQEERTGNLIQQKTKSKCVQNPLNINDVGYADACLYYIHQNPVRAGLVDKIEEWDYSSYRDYAGLRNGKLCNQELAKNILFLKSENM